MFTDCGVDVEETLILQELEDLAASLELEEMPESVDSEMILHALQIAVVCTDRTGSALIYNLLRRTFCEVTDIGKLTALRMIQIVGEEMARFIIDEHRSHPDGLFTMGQVKKRSPRQPMRLQAKRNFVASARESA